MIKTKAIALALLFLVFVPSFCSDNAIKNFLNSSGEVLYALAWPTATYKRSEFRGISDYGSQKIARLRLHGISAFSDGPLWADVEVVFLNGSLKDIRWGKHNALLMPPGETVKAMGEIIQEMAAEYERSQSSKSGTFPNIAPSQTPSKWALAAVYNETDFTIPVNYRWGDASWLQTKIKPGYYFWAWYPYPAGSHSSPPLLIAYDWTTNDQKYVEKQYSLKRLASEIKEVQYAKKYRFKQRDGKIYVFEK